MPLFKYGNRIQQIHTHGLLILLGLAALSFFPAFLIYLVFIGHYGLVFGSIIFVVFCWIVLEVILHYIYKKFSYQTRPSNHTTRRRPNVTKVKSKYATRGPRS